MADQVVDVLDRYRRDAGLSYGELWLRYFELGGMATAFELEAVLYGALQPSDHDHNVIAHALNERFVELGGSHPVPYAETDPGRKTDVTASTASRQGKAQEGNAAKEA